MRWLLLLLFLPGAAASLDGASAYLQDANAAPAHGVEAAVALGENPYAWLVHVRVPEPNGDAIDPLREIHAVAVSGYGPMHDDPIRGRIDIRDDLEANREAVHASRDDGAVSFQILASVALGLNVSDLVPLLGEGPWGCGLAPDADCTGFALAALAAAGAPPSASAVAFLRDLQGTDCGFGNAQSTAWAILGLRASGESTACAEAWLWGLQNADGGFAYEPGGASVAWATTDAILALGQPLPRSQAIAAYWHEECCFIANAEVTWHIGSGVATGRVWTPPSEPGVHVAYAHHVGNGTHGWMRLEVVNPAEAPLSVWGVLAGIAIARMLAAPARR